MPRYSGAVLDAVLQYAHYCAGESVAKPQLEMPKTLSIKVDTVTAKEILDNMDREQNEGGLKLLHDAMERLNELIPVIVSRTRSQGAPRNEDFIFWYEPSEELFDALPPTQARTFRDRLQNHAACLATPNAVTQSANVVYCSAVDQEAEIRVRDLPGRTLVVSKEHAHSGDNTTNIGTEFLSSGMYLVTIRLSDGVEQTRRIWVENANPKMSDTTHHRSITDSDSGIFFQTIAYGHDTAWVPRVGIPQIAMLELSSGQLGELGVEADEVMAKFYMRSEGSEQVKAVGVTRRSGAHFENVVSNEVHVKLGNFYPTLATDGVGRKKFTTGKFHGHHFKDSLQLDHLIPVLLRASTSGDSIGMGDIVFWYKPTPEFLAALPDSARILANRIYDPRKIESVQSEHSAISKATAYPNPSKGSLTVRVAVDAPRTLSLTIRNLLGQQVLAPVSMNANGSNEEKLDLQKLPDGIYLLDITSDIGEKYVHRIVVEH